jgi:hypothetical protein
LELFRHRTEIKVCCLDISFPFFVPATLTWTRAETLYQLPDDHFAFPYRLLMQSYPAEKTTAQRSSHYDCLGLQMLLTAFECKRQFRRSLAIGERIRPLLHFIPPKSVSGINNTLQNRSYHFIIVALKSTEISVRCRCVKLLAPLHRNISCNFTSRLVTFQQQKVHNGCFLSEKQI